MTMRGVTSRRLAVAMLVLGGALARPAAARPPEGGLCATAASRELPGPRLLILSAFPAELAPLVAHAVVEERVEVDGRIFYLGELAGVRVVLGLSGIGMVNAERTAASVLARFDLAGVVFSGVAGSPDRIGDVNVAEQFRERDTGLVFDANLPMLELARAIADEVVLETCTPVPPPSGPPVCVAFTPAIIVGGVGESGDPFNGAPFACIPGTDPVLGCALPAPAASVAHADAAASDEPPVSVDEETAAVARVAAGEKVPWVAFRGVSDGAGDPLGLPGFPAQFFAYYPLAARNAAAGTIAMLDRIARLGDGQQVNRSVCRALARSRWKRAARLIRARESLAAAIRG